jgi:hypothetical protein
MLFFWTVGITIVTITSIITVCIFPFVAIWAFVSGFREARRARR